MANWIGAITNAGAALLNEWAAEKALHFERAAGGTGTVAAVSLLAQTDLVTEKQTASIVSAENVEGGIRLKLRMANADAAYQLQQLGVWASVEGGVPTLLALYQHSDGIPIPKGSEAPDFRYTFYAVVSCSNIGEWTINVDTSTAVTLGDMGEAIAQSAEEVLRAAEENAKEEAEGHVSDHNDDPSAHAELFAAARIITDDHDAGAKFHLGVEDGKLYIQQEEE